MAKCFSFNSNIYFVQIIKKNHILILTAFMADEEKVTKIKGEKYLKRKMNMKIKFYVLVSLCIKRKEIWFWKQHFASDILLTPIMGACQGLLLCFRTNTHSSLAPDPITREVMCELKRTGLSHTSPTGLSLGGLF